MKHILKTPLTREQIKMLRMGDEILLSGDILTGRDAAHKRLCELIEKGEELPVDIEGELIYYTGPTPAKPSSPIGSAGPTTSGRMDSYTPQLLALGMLGSIGKGPRNAKVVNAMKKHGAVYLAFIGGAGALAADCITDCKVVCYADLQSEAIHRITLDNLPLIVAIDSQGGDLFVEGPKMYNSLKKEG